MIKIRAIQRPEYSNSQQTIKAGNTLLLLNTIRDRMPISRADLAKAAGLSPSTVSSLVDDLLASGWLTEKESAPVRARGRRAVMLEVNAARGCVATVELLSRGYICTLYDVRLHRLQGARVRNTLYDSGRIGDTIAELLQACRLEPCMLLGIHLIFPGIVDPVSGDLIRSIIIPDDEIIDRHLVLQLSRRYQSAHVMISSNGTIIAFEEFLAPENDAVLPLLSLNIDEAIFGGVVLCNAEKSLNFCLPLEIGHMVVDYRGKLCKCGNYGCLETLCATPVLLRQLQQLTHRKLECSDSFGADCNTASLRIVAQWLRDGDPAVVAALRDYAYTLCSGLSSAVNLFRVRSIRIGGDIALLGAPFLSLLQNSMSHEFHPLDDTYPLRVSLFVSDYEQVRLAATTMCLDSLLQE